MASKREERKQRAEAQRALQDQRAKQRKWRSRAIMVGVVLAVIVAGVMATRRDGDVNQGRVWSAEHGHWHEK